VRNERRIQAMVWLALLNLAALRSPVAPSAYATAPLLWLLALLAVEIEGRYWMGTALAAAWVVMMGAPPLSDKIDLVVGLAGQALMLAFGIWILLSPAVDGGAGGYSGTAHRMTPRAQESAVEYAAHRRMEKRWRRICTW
jgi:hypothetical protein